jgi:hypothetical protein
MDDRRFDAFTRALGQEGSRRTLLKGLLGLGGVAAAGAVLRDTDAARRGQPGPSIPTAAPTLPPQLTAPPLPPTGTTAPACPGIQIPCGADCCCPAGNTKCGSDCCPDGQAECCDGACCYGTCFGEEVCCPPGSRACDGVCYPGGCCTVADCGLLCQVCGSDHVCRSCEEVGQECQNGTCVPTVTPTSTSVSTSTPISTSTPTHSPTPTTTPTPTPCGQSGVGSCTANDQCCSGICQAGLCVATIAGTCTTGFDLCSGISTVPCGGSCVCGTLSNGSLICFASGACFDNCEECGGATCDPNMPCCAAGCFEPCTPDGTPG